MGGLGKHNWHPKPFIFYLAVIGGGIGVVLWLIPQIAKPIYLAWYFIAGCMGFVMGNLLFSVFFYLLFTPLGLLRRAFGKKVLRKGFDKDCATYWEDAEKGIDPKRYYRQF
jgi:hypothetical protein